MNPTNPNEDGFTFAQWQFEVDIALVDLCGLTAACLADYPAYDMWNDSVPPGEAAECCLTEYNDFPSDLLNY
jgi:hypothetical protein